jgi:hypothetical protein
MLFAPSKQQHQPATSARLRPKSSPRTHTAVNVNSALNINAFSQKVAFFASLNHDDAEAVKMTYEIVKSIIDDPFCRRDLTTAGIAPAALRIFDDSDCESGVIHAELLRVLVAGALSPPPHVEVHIVHAQQHLRELSLLFVLLRALWLTEPMDKNLLVAASQTMRAVMHGISVAFKQLAVARPLLQLHTSCAFTPCELLCVVAAEVPGCRRQAAACRVRPVACGCRWLHSGFDLKTG